MKHFIFHFVVVTAIFSCKPAPAPALFTNLYARYDQAEQKIRAEATFAEAIEKESPKSIVLQHGVSFWGSGMETRTLPGGVIRYEFERIGPLSEKIPVHIKDNQSRGHDLDLQIPSVRDFNFLETPLRRESGFNLTLDASPLETTEKLIVIFTDQKNNSQTLEVNGPVAKLEIPFAPAQLRNLEPGKINAFVVRTKKMTHAGESITWNIQTECYSAEKTFELE